MTATKNNIILGIDPGSLVMGYAIIDVNGSHIRVLTMDVLKLAAVADIYERLEMIHTKVNLLISQYKPHTFAIEAPFFGKNVQSMLKLGRAQGVAIAAAMQGKIGVTEYSPKKVKQSITGNGNAAKEQVWKMLQQTLGLEEKPQYFDATDALAVALCHHYQTSSPIGKMSKGFKGWEEFVVKNQDRILKK
ncbi:crossover junction endodeoxyribonuclease RuvC [Panacibacter sp. DH6]|uniref:Crossover junction endodeoxyribonuclease RuvC n=1 Tax=Panacibacter microcysteis TaxID=2793269 RepID=A0A931E798_9BACT|nr:crossover junction endodeoxyribonuclease RuvC [Panacibacter microcysteis]MBG9376474.1 crossover junction endodeoxyribonuclease RuvC [Panacibacter microcysteis]